MRVYLVGDPDQAKLFFKPTKGLASHFAISFVMKNVLGAPDDVMPLYNKDDSGQLARPTPGSQTPGEYRIRYFHSRAAHHFLAGKSGIGLGERYLDVLDKNFADVDIDKIWKDMADLSGFIENLVFPASVESICGSALLKLNPNLTEDFWTFEKSIPTLLKLPWWLAPRAYRSREKMLTNIRKWHAYANERSDCTMVGKEDPEWDAFFGSKYIRERQRFMQEIDLMNADGRASEDLGFLFAYASLFPFMPEY